MKVKRYQKRSIWGDQKVDGPEFFYDEQDVIKMLDEKDERYEKLVEAANEMVLCSVLENMKIPAFTLRKIRELDDIILELEDEN